MRRLASFILLVLTMAALAGPAGASVAADYVYVGGAALRLKKTGAGGFVPEYTHFDSQGSAVAATNAAGSVTWRERYAPFGEELLNPAANANNTAYTGHLKDDATGLNYMQARVYDPIIGRFLSTDPIGYQDQLNLYAYVHNDPVNSTDPTGEFAVLLAVPAYEAAVYLAGAATAAYLAYKATKDVSNTLSNANHNANSGSAGGDVGRGGDGRILSPNDNGGPPSDPEPNRPVPAIPDFTQHGGERADERGIPAVVVGDTLMNPEGVSTPGDNDTTIFHNADNNVTAVISNETGSVVTTFKGTPGGAEGQAIRDQLQEKEPR